MFTMLRYLTIKNYNILSHLASLREDLTENPQVTEEITHKEEFRSVKPHDDHVLSLRTNPIPNPLAMLPLVLTNKFA